MSPSESSVPQTISGSEMTCLRSKRRRGFTPSGAAFVILILAVAVVSVVYIDTTQGQQQQVTDLQTKLQQLQSSLSSLNGTMTTLRKTLPVMDQAPSIRTVRETWYLSPEAHQDRFDPSFIVVNQGDTIRMTFIDNDTVAHDFVLGPPYSIVVNASVPGLVNDLTHQTFTTPAKNNSPGVVVAGTPGNVTASYSFEAKYPGIFEFVCTYHAQIGMIGYLVVLPNLAYSGPTSPSGRPTNKTATSVMVSILPGAANPASGLSYSPDSITVVIGVNSTVEWTNNDTATHTVTANGGSFDSGPMSSGGTFAYEFTTPGVYDYHCTYHPYMTGTVVVKK